MPVEVVLGVPTDSQQFDLLVSGVRYSELLRRWAKLTSRGQAVLDLNAPVTESDHGCDFSGVGGGVDRALFKDKILEAQRAREKDAALMLK